MKKVLTLAIAAAMTLAVAAPVFADDVTLNALFMKQAGYSEEDVTAMTQAFTEETGIAVNPTFVAYEELAPKILTSAATGGYDVILGDCIWPAQFAKAGLVLDVTDKVNADLSKGFEFCAFRVRSITADTEGNSERKSSFITVENKSMKLIVEE